MASNIQPLYPPLDLNEPQRKKVSRSNSKPDRPPMPPIRKYSNDVSKSSEPEIPVTPIEEIPDVAGKFVNPPDVNLEINQVRWFYREPDKYWQPFCGCDSVRLEQSYRVYGDYNTGKLIRIPVMGDMYEVYLFTRVLKPIYWDEVYGKQTVVMRAWWFGVRSGNFFTLWFIQIKRRV